MGLLSLMWKISEMLLRMKMSDVVSTLNTLRNFKFTIGRRKQTFLTDRGTAGGNGTSTGSTFNIFCGRNESLISCKKASASDTCSGRDPVMGGGW